MNSGALEDNSEEEIVDIYAPEIEDMANGVTFEDLPDRSGKIKKTSSTDYKKVAKALGGIIDAGIKVSLVDINKSDFGFKPDVENNQILFGMKSLLNLNDDMIYQIIANRPYVSPADFVNRIQPKKQSMVSLIKSGAFDKMYDRKFVMAWYLWSTCDKKNRLTLQNMPTLKNYNILPTDKEYKMPFKVYEFNRYLKSQCKKGQTSYLVDDRALNFLSQIDKVDLVNGDFIMDAKAWDKVYQSYMDVYRNWIAKDGKNILAELNTQIFKEEWDKYAKEANYSAWEMEVMCFYYHEHELKNTNKLKYGLCNFNLLPDEPEVERTFVKGNKEIKIFKLSKICGTCISKNKAKGIVSVLTPDSGVVDVRFSKEYFSMFDKRISQVNADGTKSVVEKSWFDRGNMIIVQGIKIEDGFMAKKYASSGGHQLYRIDKVLDNGDLVLQEERALKDA